MKFSAKNLFFKIAFRRFVLLLVVYGQICLNPFYKSYYSSRRVDGRRIGTFQADVIFADHKIRKAKLFAGRDGHIGITRGHLTSSWSITKARKLISHEIKRGPNGLDEEMAIEKRIGFGLDSTNSWYDVIARWGENKREQFIDIFKPSEVRVPAEVLAKNFADRIQTQFPKTWKSLTDGTLKAEVMAADGAPVMPKFVVELRKIPQFKHIQYSRFLIICHVMLPIF